jgi:ribose transport system substrate-binding protein
VDGAPDIEDALKSETLIQASSAQDPFKMAQMAVEIGNEILQGKAPAQQVTLIPADLITRDNVGQYKGWTSK